MIAGLVQDQWRTATGFSDDIAHVNERLWSATDDAECEQALNQWLSSYQPCLFGRAAAAARTIAYCILRDADLENDDKFIHQKIQDKRIEWAGRAYDGLASAFVLLAASPRLAHATPTTVYPVAHRLCELYLQTEVDRDSILLEDVFLEKPGRTRHTWLFRGGVNFFASQGDRRWWHDHRIPGGIGFSVNSVGHMVKSNILARAMSELDGAMQAEDGWTAPKIESLPRALFFAMQTIANAADVVSGRATWLIDKPAPSDSCPPCPVELPRKLQDKSHCSYEGYYHTDFTLPSEYFNDDVERSEDQEVYDLDFTYLHDDRLTNPDHRTIALGRRIRQGDAYGRRLATVRRERETPAIVSIRSAPILREALNRRAKAASNR